MKIKNGNVATWSYDNDGDFTHVSQWKDWAWMHPYTHEKGKVVFGIVGRKQEPMSKRIYAIYHGRFAEMLLMHFDRFISDIYITSDGDARYDCFKE